MINFLFILYLPSATNEQRVRNERIILRAL